MLGAGSALYSSLAGLGALLRQDYQCRHLACSRLPLKAGIGQWGVVDSFINLHAASCRVCMFLAGSLLLPTTFGPAAHGNALCVE